MREILFRGKSFFSDDWIFGYYTKQSFGIGFSDAIVEYDGISTKPIQIKYETLGQYTGIDDIDGNKIFEGDIIEKECDDGRFIKYRIDYDDGAFVANYTSNINKDVKKSYLSKHWIAIGKYRVIGNIYNK